MKKQKLMEENWDICIILDACRYDFFEETYRDYLSGDLEKKESKGSSTLDWLVNNFDERYDVTYFSSNPYINSLGISLNESKWGSSCGYEWKATDHFNEIIDVWDFGWNQELGTVHPKEVNKAASSKLSGCSDRVIIHYMQPHSPFISNGKARKLKRIRKGFTQNKRGYLSRLNKRLREKIESKLTNKSLPMKMGMLMNLGLSDLITSIKNNGLREKLMNYYTENLELALGHVNELIEEIDEEKKIVVTSDHGEAFGEQGIWEHHIETDILSLREVPWLEINN